MSKFRTIEISDPRYERENLRFVTVKSSALRGRGDITFFVPPNCETLKDLPLVILLHGVYGSHWAWSQKGAAHLTALKLIEMGTIRPMVLAMPSDGLWGDGSGYVKHPAADYERWIVEDVTDCALEIVECLGALSPLFIAGLSMGGYGALRLGGKYPELFRGISGHSSITHPEQLKLFVEEPLVSYGAALQSEDAGGVYWLRRNKDKLPPLRFDCGIGDLLIEDNRRLHHALTAEGIAHEYREFEGKHSWDYWSLHIADTLLFFESHCDSRKKRETGVENFKGHAAQPNARI